MHDPVSASALDLNFGFAWIAFGVAVGLHAWDEAAHDFLALYNPNALVIRRRIHLPVPVFTLHSFIVTLSCAVCLLFLLAPFAFYGTYWVRMAAVPVGVLAGILNAFIHMSGSVYYRRLMAGALSAPLLLIAGIWLLYACRLL